MIKPIIIGIGGAHSSAGKTTYATSLLEKLKGWGAIKYTKTALYCSITDDLNILAKKDKDTGRLLDSGAERVLWVQSPPDEIADILPMAVERLSDLKGIIVEGNSAIEFLKPDIIIFIFGDDSSRIKESAKRILKIADAVVYRGSDELIVTSDRLKKRLGLKDESEDSLPGSCPASGGSAEADHPSLKHEQFISCITDMIDNKERIRSLLKGKAIDGRLPCPALRGIAEELSVSYKEVGDAADELGMKIVDCELGCF